VDGLFDHLEWVAYVWFVMVGGGGVIFRTRRLAVLVKSRNRISDGRTGGWLAHSFVLDRQ